MIIHARRGHSQTRVRGYSSRPGQPPGCSDGSTALRTTQRATAHARRHTQGATAAAAAAPRGQDPQGARTHTSCARFRGPADREAATCAGGAGSGKTRGRRGEGALPHRPTAQPTIAPGRMRDWQQHASAPRAGGPERHTHRGNSHRKFGWPLQASELTERIVTRTSPGVALRHQMENTWHESQQRP